MIKNFLITGHINGSNPFAQQTMLYGLVRSLKNYFPDCFVIVACQSDLTSDIQKYADYIIVDKATINQPHGVGERALTKAGLDVLKLFGRNDCFKLCYDFIIDESNYTVFDQWLSHQKEFVGCSWNSGAPGIGSWVWYSTVELQENLLDFDHFDNFLECKMLEMYESKNLQDRCFIYKDHNEMFNGTWSSNCDLVHSAGTVLRHHYGSVLSIIKLNDYSESLTPLILHSLTHQLKRVDHVLIIDERKIKQDLRLSTVYQILFNTLSELGITWNLIFGTENNNQLVYYLTELGYDWCWLINPRKIPNQTSLKEIYQYIILNFNIGTISDKSGNLFFKNKIIVPDQNISDLNNFVIGKLQELNYKNINL